MNFVRFSISYFCGLNGSIEQYEWFKRLNDRQVNELIGLIDDWLIIDTEPIDSNVWLDRERWTNVDFVTIFVSGTVTLVLWYYLGSDIRKQNTAEAGARDICAVPPEPSLFALIIYWTSEIFRERVISLTFLMAANARLNHMCLASHFSVPM